MPEQLATEPAVPTAEPEPLADTDTDTAPDEPAAEDSAERDDAGDADQGEVVKARRDAAKYRARLRETETERDQLRDQLAAQRRAVIEWRASTTHGGVDGALLDAAGIDVDELLSDAGHLDMAKVDEFVAGTAKRFNIARGFTVNRAQSQAGTGGTPTAPPKLADAFRKS